MTYYSMNSSSSVTKGQPHPGAHVHQQYPDNSANVSPRNHKNHRASSDRLPHGISFNLVSLVTKFEALDALSLPFKTPSLQPAPLKISRNSSQHNNCAGSRYRRRLSTIFGPKRGSAERHDFSLSEEEFKAGDIFGSSNSRQIKPLHKKVDARKLRKAQTSYKPSSIRLRGGVWDPADATHGEGIGAVAAQYVQNELPDEKLRGSIRDRIKFYDGAVSTGNNTRAHPSANNTAAPNTPISLSRSRFLDRSYFLTPSTGSSKRTCLHIPDADAPTPTRSNPTSTARQHLKFGLTPNHHTPQSSPSRYSLNNVTPESIRGAKQYKNGQDNSPSRLPIRQRRMPGPRRGRRNAMVETKQFTALGLGGDGSTAPSIVGQDQSSRPLSRRRLSNKIEELYRAKSMEKKRDDIRETAQQQEATITSTVEANKAHEYERQATESRTNRLSGITRSKVAAMRKLFDGKFSPRSATPETPCCGLDPFQDIIPSSPTQQQEQKARLPDPITQDPPTPPPLPLVKERKASKLSLRIGQEPGLSGAASAFDMTKTVVSHPTSPIKKLSPARSKLIGDKVKIFETTPEISTDTAQPRRGKAFRRRLSKSLRSLFEAPPRKSQEDESERAKQIEASSIPKRFPSPDGNGVASKRGSIGGRWNKIPTAVSSGGDGAISEKQPASPAEEDEFAEMVVKGVECGLKQPRPVRAIEMKRMALLCRDRMGEIMDREKGRVSQRRKF
ncbi:hypothetical protein IFR05_003825 [Cadophora sp. M221]|nr:hypothetical protein IFR05_003825 [Cadophora sp. M221]